jgi:hypothetical protein
VVATGDQQDGGWVAGERPEMLNYQYRNRFRIDDYRRSAQLYRRIRPDLIIGGHWVPRTVTDDYLDELARAGDALARLHRELLPLDVVDFGAEGFGARIEPYRSDVRGGDALELTVIVRNPFHHPDDAALQLVVPAGWNVVPRTCRVQLDAGGEGEATFEVRAPEGLSARRARVAVDMTVGSTRFGQQAEALVTVR